MIGGTGIRLVERASGVEQASGVERASCPFQFPGGQDAHPTHVHPLI
ncbi:MAG: hypothetical protein F6J90_23415 [Moorea sp. SIOASIH]|nr:hypothetical protein [Moorena sp. SIOASIH]NEO39123.1 hypothetical protein [Moorena sp. SIOASIH]